MTAGDQTGDRRRSLVDLESTFLPTGRMLQISRVTLLEGSTIEGELDLGPAHWVYPCHFPGDPIFPGTLMIEAAGQLVALWAWTQGQRGRPRLLRSSAAFHNGVDPTIDRLQLRAEVRKKRHLSFGTIGISTPEVEVATLKVVLAVLA